MPSLGNLPFVLGVMGLTQAVLLSAVYFMSGHLAPIFFGDIYSKTTMITRTLIMSFTVFPLCNLVQSIMYSKFSPALVTPTTLFAMIVVQIVLTAVVLSVKPSWLIIPAGALVAIGCLWVNKILSAL